MAMPVPWWAWPVGAVAGLVWITRAALKRNRARIENELVAHLQEHHPSLRWVRQEGKTMVLHHETAGELTLRMNKIYVGAMRTQPNDKAARRAIYEQFARGLLEVAVPARPTAERLRPKLLPEGTPGREKALSRPLEALGLRIYYVLDSPTTVRYVTAAEAAELGLDEVAIHERALANVALPEQVVREALDGKKMQVIKMGDGHDAARILALPAHLREGETLAALIPDDHTLLLMKLPEGDLAPLQKLARTPTHGPPLFGEVVRVTRDGLQRVT
jgi:uncharacterized protein YtpQ (UPF0354 family)